MNNINSKAGTEASVCGTYVLGCATLKLILAQSLHDLLFLPLPGRKANKYVTLSPNASLYNFKANSYNIYVEEVYSRQPDPHARSLVTRRSFVISFFVYIRLWAAMIAWLSVTNCILTPAPAFQLLSASSQAVSPDPFLTSTRN